jgi:hypothetical protein
VERLEAACSPSPPSPSLGWRPSLASHPAFTVVFDIDDSPLNSVHPALSCAGEEIPAESAD